MSVDLENISDLETALMPILKEHQVKRASLFGSRARGDNTSRSDIDIAVEFEGRKSLLDLVGLKLAIEDSLGISADLVTFDSIHPSLRIIFDNERVDIL